MRRALAIAAGVAVAIVGALIVGEYPFRGLEGLVTGVLFGLFVAEAVVVVGAERTVVFAVAAAVAAAGGLGWAVWRSIDGGSPRPDPVPTVAWVALVLGAATAFVRARPGRSRSSAGRSAAESDAASGPHD